MGEKVNQTPRIGDRFTFMPDAFSQHEDPGKRDRINGRVIYVNEEHRYFTVAGEINGIAIRESFKW